MEELASPNPPAPQRVPTPPRPDPTPTPVPPPLRPLITLDALNCEGEYVHTRQIHLTPSEMDWVGIGVDIAGIVGDATKRKVPEGSVLWIATEIAEFGTVVGDVVAIYEHFKAVRNQQEQLIKPDAVNTTVSLVMNWGSLNIQGGWVYNSVDLAAEVAIHGLEIREHTYCITDDRNAEP